MTPRFDNAPWLPASHETPAETREARALIGAGLLALVAIVLVLAWLWMGLAS